MIKERIANLIGVRTIVTFALTGGLLYGFIVGKVDAKDFLEYVGIVLIFFFTKEDKKVKEENKITSDKQEKEETKEIGRYG